MIIQGIIFTAPGFWILEYQLVSLQLYEGVKPTLGESEKFEATPDKVELNGKSFKHISHIRKLVYIYIRMVYSD